MRTIWVGVRSFGAVCLLIVMAVPAMLAPCTLAQDLETTLDQILSGSHRDPKDAARDRYRHPNADAMFRAFYDALKPSGVLGVVDHRAAPGTPFEKQIESGYLTEDYVIGLAQRAGFELDARSEVNANPRDTKDHPMGVWTLPPTLALGDQDRDKYLTIGESDRMTLGFVKPGFVKRDR